MGELSQEEIEKVKAIIQNPRQYNIPDWFLNRRKDMQTGKPLHLHAHQLAAKFREDLKSGRRRAGTGDCAITGDSKCADRTQRPMDTETAPWASSLERTDCTDCADGNDGNDS